MFPWTPNDGGQRQQPYYPPSQGGGVGGFRGGFPEPRQQQGYYPSQQQEQGGYNGGGDSFGGYQQWYGGASVQAPQQQLYQDYNNGYSQPPPPPQQQQQYYPPPQQQHQYQSTPDAYAPPPVQHDRGFSSSPYPPPSNDQAPYYNQQPPTPQQYDYNRPQYEDSSVHPAAFQHHQNSYQRDAPPSALQQGGYGGSRDMSSGETNYYQQQDDYGQKSYQQSYRHSPPLSHTRDLSAVLFPPSSSSRANPPFSSNSPPSHFNEPPPHFAPDSPPPPSSYTPYPVHAHASRSTASSYSNLSGRRKTLLIGINYTGTEEELRGCWNDVENLSGFIRERFGYKDEDVVELVDRPGMDDDLLPTRENILREIENLVQDAQPNDALFFHFSGHGSQIPTDDPTELDGLAETIIPLDWEEEGDIVDDELHELLVMSLPKGCRLTAIFDCCHSGSMLDLPNCYSTSGKLKAPSHLSSAKTGATSALSAFTKRRDIRGALSALAKSGKQIRRGKTAQEFAKYYKSSEADCISWSGCKDEQTSADAMEDGAATGALSHAFVAALKANQRQTYLQLLNSIRDKLREGGYDQKPQLSCSHELDCNLMAAF